MMKKLYEAPILTLLALKASDFLSTSGEPNGDATGDDVYDSPYGEKFS